MINVYFLAVFICSYMFLAPVFGYLGDRYNRKLIMSVGIGFWSLVTLASSYTPNDVSGYCWSCSMRSQHAIKSLNPVISFFNLCLHPLHLKETCHASIVRCFKEPFVRIFECDPVHVCAAFLGPAFDSRSCWSRRSQLFHHRSHHHCRPLCEGGENNYAVYLLLCHSCWQVVENSWLIHL